MSCVPASLIVFLNTGQPRRLDLPDVDDDDDNNNIGDDDDDDRQRN